MSNYRELKKEELKVLKNDLEKELEVLKKFYLVNMIITQKKPLDLLVQLMTL